MKKAVALVSAVLVMLLCIGTASAGAKGGKKTDSKADKQAFQVEMKARLNTMQSNHRALKNLSTSVKKTLAAIRESIENAEENGLESPELTAVLPQVKAEIKAIAKELKAIGNNGKIKRLWNNCLKYAQKKKYDQALAEMDKLLALQEEYKAKITALLQEAEALKAEVLAIISAIPLPTETTDSGDEEEPSPEPTQEPVPEPTQEPVPEPTLSPEPSPSI